MNARRTLSVTQRTHTRLTQLFDGYDDSMDKVINRLIDHWYRTHESKS